MYDAATQLAYAKIVSHAWRDDSFRQAFLKDPAKVLRDAGVDVGASAKVVVHENRGDEVHLVLPKAPAADLTHRDLDDLAKIVVSQSWDPNPN